MESHPARGVGITIAVLNCAHKNFLLDPVVKKITEEESCGYILKMKHRRFRILADISVSFVLKFYIVDWLNMSVFCTMVEFASIMFSSLFYTSAYCIEQKEQEFPPQKSL